MTKQELDLLKIAAGFTAQLGAGPAEVVGTEVLDTDLTRSPARRYPTRPSR